LSVEVKSPDTLSERIEVIKRRTQFDNKDQEFLEFWNEQDLKIRRKILRARKKLDEINSSEQILEKCAALCMALGADGLRGELTLLRAAKAQAALENKNSIETEQLRKVATICMGHRLRKDPLDEVGSTVRVEKKVEETLSK